MTTYRHGAFLGGIRFSLESDDPAVIEKRGEPIAIARVGTGCVRASWASAVPMDRCLFLLSASDPSGEDRAVTHRSERGGSVLLIVTDRSGRQVDAPSVGVSLHYDGGDP